MAKQEHTYTVTFPCCAETDLTAQGLLEVLRHHESAVQTNHLQAAIMSAARHTRQCSFLTESGELIQISRD